MKASTIREMILRRPGPFTLRLSDGTALDVAHPDFMALPGPQAEESKDTDQVAVVYLSHRTRILSLDHVVSVDVPKHQAP